MIAAVQRPPFVSVTLASGLAWRGGGGFVYQEKIDGVWCPVHGPGWLVVGERTRDGTVHVFDLLAWRGQDFRREPLRLRLAALREWFAAGGGGEMLNGPTGGDVKRPIKRFLPVAAGSGGEFLQAVLAHGGEGVVAKPADGPWGTGWFKCKRVETFDCIVSALNPGRQSVRLMLDGEDVGSCPVRGGQLERLAVGQIVEVAAYGRTAAGKLREARFVRTRPDKDPVPRLIARFSGL